MATRQFESLAVFYHALLPRVPSNSAPARAARERIGRRIDKEGRAQSVVSQSPLAEIGSQRSSIACGDQISLAICPAAVSPRCPPISRRRRVGEVPRRPFAENKARP